MRTKKDKPRTAKSLECSKQADEKALHGKPLIQYSIEAALVLSDAKNICVNTDDDAVIAIAKKLSVDVPFRRPDSAQVARRWGAG